MCMSATCSDCTKKSWRGCGKHVPSAMAGVDEADWCTCEPKFEVEGKKWPRAAPAVPLFGGFFGGGGGKQGGKDGL